MVSNHMTAPTRDIESRFQFAFYGRVCSAADDLDEIKNVCHVPAIVGLWWPLKQTTKAEMANTFASTTAKGTVPPNRASVGRHVAADRP